MDLKYNPEEEKFRAEVRAFFDAELPTDIRTKLQLGRRIAKDDMVRWQKILFTRRAGARPTGPSPSAARAGMSCSSIYSRRSAPTPARRGRTPFH